MSRTFETRRVKRADEGPPTEVVPLQCSCGETLEIASKSKEALPSDFVHRQASIKGWKLGRHAAEDRCPKCQSRYRRKSTIEPRVVTRPTIKEPEMSKPQTEPVREMLKDDRRIIFAKIDEVYTGHHYTGGWTDKKIAEDLNVPRAWVADVRSQFFGEAGDNEEVQQFLAELDSLKGSLETFAAERQKTIKRMDDLATSIARLLKIGEEIRKATTP